MPSTSSLRHAPATVAVLAALLTGCGGDADGSAGGGAATDVAVAAADDSCTVAETDLPAGGITFAVRNEGSKVTEVYVYAESDGEFTKVVSEVENIGPGTSRDLRVDLAAGTYEVACKPGQTGDGIRTKITVSGEGGEAAESGDDGYDRELELNVDDSRLTGLEEATATTGERIEFKLQNSAETTRTLEVLDPAGEEVAEFDVPAGEDGEAVVELAEAGTWIIKIEGGPKELQAPLTVTD